MERGLHSRELKSPSNPSQTFRWDCTLMRCPKLEPLSKITLKFLTFRNCVRDSKCLLLFEGAKCWGDVLCSDRPLGHSPHRATVNFRCMWRICLHNAWLIIVRKYHWLLLFLAIKRNYLLFALIKRLQMGVSVKIRTGRGINELFKAQMMQG